ncbi:GNAT family N-acetyltransferase [Parvicella tangerina]|uniref:N-acetyltransferase domain-containing protein n=1 Tax=Parvicella tangerina TaxID=2829795 RepID=A0A916JPN1_9FLAO|nr:GNAT family protein [Parvicella tangerina]CAG5085667.1 hypothetical protein CRYO30217_02832 [Parvicella tangerina]
MEFQFIYTDRLKLRLVDQQVMDKVFAAYSHEELISFFGEVIAEKEIERYHGGTSMYNRTFLYFQMILKDSNELIGWCGFHTWYTNHSRAEIGYMIFDEKNMDHGYMSEAMSAVIEYGFHEMELHRIEAMIGKYNRPSLRLMNKFHFEEEGCLREHYFTGGVYEDSLVFGLIKPQK